MLRTVSTFSLFLAALSFAPDAFAATKLAVVDIQQAMDSTADWKRVVKELEGIRDARQKDLEKKQQALKDKKTQLDAKKALVDPKTLAKDEEELLREFTALRQAFQQGQQELTAMEQQAAQLMYRRLDAVTQQIAAKKDYSFVFEAGPELTPNVLYAKAPLDITKQVVAGYEEAFKGKPLKLPKK